MKIPLNVWLALGFIFLMVLANFIVPSKLKGLPIFFAVFTIFAFVLDHFIAFGIVNKQESIIRTWQRLPAKLKFVDAQCAGRGCRSYLLVCDYEYNYKCKFVSGKSEDFGPHFDTKSAAMLALKEWPIGKSIQVYVNPKNPEQSEFFIWAQQNTAHPKSPYRKWAWVFRLVFFVFPVLMLIVFFVNVCKPDPARYILKKFKNANVHYLGNERNYYSPNLSSIQKIIVEPLSAFYDARGVNAMVTERELKFFGMDVAKIKELLGIGVKMDDVAVAIGNEMCVKENKPWLDNDANDTCEEWNKASNKIQQDLHRIRGPLMLKQYPKPSIFWMPCNETPPYDDNPLHKIVTEKMCSFYVTHGYAAPLVDRSQFKEIGMAIRDADINQEFIENIIAHVAWVTKRKPPYNSEVRPLLWDKVRSDLALIQGDAFAATP